MKNQMLKKFMDAKQEEIKALQMLAASGKSASVYDGPRPGFLDALKRSGPSIIAEYKRSSPSKGEINKDLSPEQAAQMFVNGGASCCSVLTEKMYFQGDLDYLQIFADQNLPVLRKDFLFHPLQIIETAATKSSALLLIVRVIEDQMLLTELVRSSLDYSIEPVVEIFSEKELDLATAAGARLILVNNRDLDLLKVDLKVSRKLIKNKPAHQTWICASGIEEKDQIDEFHALGFEAFLIGTSIMSAPNPQQKLKELGA
ncbi:indole-3-glycerol phosphate synthase TrpC [Desulfonatronovibrio magnus]|uniref:indole-3-glycerol phosphate synthase TrpC n=1 Tax=Desulfonatronovibrio magnus TaxID=698827 RepID=UPI000A53386F|nr:indole-3-glycerol-phosphate synthase [Desulfonatronovibrio magnus]